MMKKTARNRAVEIALQNHETEQLEAWSRSRTIPHALVQRAKIVLLAAQGLTNLQIAQRVQLNRINVGKWRRRFANDGISGLYDQLRPGRPRSISDKQVAELIHKTLRRKPKTSQAKAQNCHPLEHSHASRAKRGLSYDSASGVACLWLTTPSK